MKKIILSLLIAISVFSVGCLDAFALTFRVPPVGVIN